VGFAQSICSPDPAVERAISPAGSDFHALNERMPESELDRPSGQGAGL
jgi:hypothetical protein